MLVDYGNQTSLVAIVAQLTQRPVGLVSYGQRPYLLVAQTPDSGPALATLKTLSQNGFRTLLVESAQATLLTPAIQLP
ncbi:MAG: hypothetical protein HC824_15665 [Synechococcales cyanobacterium RM1_1_8]|nr:hypothetical protein [Synechococcales cyanobacterium RM1_1_8]